MSENPAYAVAVVGAGAAGLMSAISAARAGARVLLLDSREKIGAKILISGGTRCNVTNRRVTPSDYQGGPPHIVKHVLEAFTPDRARHFFEEIGVGLALEPSGKYFPVTNSGKTVLEALVKECARAGVELKTGVKIGSLKKEDGLFALEAKGVAAPFRARRVILATGGLSYPETGSDGTGLALAEKLGHVLVPTAPALTPLLTDDKEWASLSGLTLEDVKLSYYGGGKKAAEARGGFLFAHFGFSGPAALDISRHFAYASANDRPVIEANFLPKHTEQSLISSLDAFCVKHPKKALKTFLTEQEALPERFGDVLLKKLKMMGGRRLREFPRREKMALVRQLVRCALPVSGVYGYKKAEVTAGGVDLKEVNASTMESKKVPGLYFAGEMLDMDGRIGGFNFQWAWSTGQIAGTAAAKC